MKHLPRTLTAMLVAIICCSAMQARADVILQQVSPSSGGGSYFLPGLSITTPAGGPWNNIRFNFYDAARVDPVGSGYVGSVPTLIILTQEFLGNPTNMGPLTPGYLAENESGDLSLFYFDPGVVLQPSTTYWFMTTYTLYDSLLDRSVLLNGAVIAGGVPGVQTYYAETSGSPGTTYSDYVLDSSSAYWDYRLQGTPVPEPGTVALLGIGLAGLATARKRRK